jgi:hypothetical protein
VKPERRDGGTRGTQAPLSDGEREIFQSFQAKNNSKCPHIETPINRFRLGDLKQNGGNGKTIHAGMIDRGFTGYEISGRVSLRCNNDTNPKLFHVCAVPNETEGMMNLLQRSGVFSEGLYRLTERRQTFSVCVLAAVALEHGPRGAKSRNGNAWP